MMAGKTTPPSEEIPLPSLSESALKHHDLAADSEPPTLRPTGNPADDAASVASDASSSTNSSDEFDWNEADDDAQSTVKGKTTKARRGRAAWVGFMKLARPIRTLLVGVIGAGIFITPLLVFVLRFPNNVARHQVFVWSLWLSIIWAASCATYLMVDLLPRIIVKLVNLFGGHVENLKTQIELTLAVSAWIKLFLDVVWAWIALSVIRSVYHPPGNYWVIINRVMQALFSATLLLLLEKVFLRLVAINFHEKALAERLAENRLGLKALDRLSNAQPTPRTPASAGGAARKGHKAKRSSQGLDMFSFKRHGAQEPASATGSSRSSPIREKGAGSSSASVHKEDVHDGDVQPQVLKGGKAGRGGNKRSSRATGRGTRKKAMAAVIVDQLGAAVGQVALKNSKFNREGDFGSLDSARKLARKLFQTLSDVMPPRSHLIVEDFEPYFHSTTEAHAAFSLFDKDGNGDISKKEMREAVQRIYRERKSLIASLKDVSSAVAKLDAVLLSVALVIILFICLLIFNRENTLASLVPVATIVLGFSFVFGHSAQTLFESLIFIFSTHVFDVGDLVLIDDQVLFVREFGLFSTTFRRVDGMEVIAPNALLSSAKLVHNLRRSNAMWETTNLMVAYTTPMEVIEQLRQRMKAYVAQNNREWSNVDVHIDKMEYQNAITLIIAMEHRSSWQDWGGRWGRRTEFMRHLKTVLEELDVRYTLPVQPVVLPRDAPFPPRGGNDSLGNAGFFAGSPTLGRAPTRSIRPGPDTF